MISIQPEEVIYNTMEDEGIACFLDLADINDEERFVIQVRESTTQSSRELLGYSKGLKMREYEFTIHYYSIVDSHFQFLTEVDSIVDILQDLPISDYARELNLTSEILSCEEYISDLPGYKNAVIEVSISIIQ